MEFNVNLIKCKFNRNLKFQYQMNDGWIKPVDEERRLRVLISQDFKLLKQCLWAKNKANLMLGIINRGVSKLYRSYVRPHLEYCIQFWTPINVKDTDMIEGVQRRATKMIPNLRNSSYEEKLKRLGMFSLICRRLRDDMIEVLKMIHYIDKVNLGKHFCIDEEGRTRKQFMFNSKLRYLIEFFPRKVISY